MSESVNDIQIVKAFLPDQEGSEAKPDVWPEMVDLPDLPDVMPFDYQLLPESFRAWVTDIAERMQCPPDFPAVAAMITLAAIVGRKIGIRPKQFDDWQVIPNLWGAVIGRPGIMKTPALNEPLKVLNRFELEAKQEFDRASVAFETDEKIEKTRQQVLQQDLKKALKDKSDLGEIKAKLLEVAYKEPIRKRFLLNDPTVEKLGEILCDNPDGVTVFRDELTGLLRSLDREGNETSRAFYLEAWNGNSSFTFDRIGRGTIDISACCVSILGGIQPGPFVDYLRAAIRGGKGDDGLIQRFQLVVWPDANRAWENVDQWPDTDAKNQAINVYKRLRDLDPTAIGGQHDDYESVPFLRFAKNAQELFDSWRCTLESRLRSGEEHPAVEAHLSKYRSLVPSLALLIHLADEPGGGPVAVAALEKALKWAHYLESHANRVYNVAEIPGLDAAKLLLRQIKSGKLGSEFRVRDVYRKGWSGLTDQTEVEVGVEILMDHSFVITQAPIQITGRKSPTYLINPKLLQDSI